MIKDIASINIAFNKIINLFFISLYILLNNKSDITLDTLEKAIIIDK